MDFVDKEHRTLALGTPLPCPLYGFAHILHPRHNCGEGDHLRPRGVGKKPSEGGLADPRGTPKDHGMKTALLEHPAQGPLRAKKMSLPHHLLHALGAQPGRKGRAEGLIGAEKIGHGAASSSSSAPSGTMKTKSSGAEGRGLSASKRS